VEKDIGYHYESNPDEKNNLFTGARICHRQPWASYPAKPVIVIKTNMRTPGV
jgi:hypothetical protein